MTHLGVKQGRLFGKSDALLNTLPSYRPDDELQQEVRNIFFDLAPLHIDLKGITTSQQRDTAEEIVSNFPGVRSVINDPVIDPKADLLPVLSPTGVEGEDQVPGRYVRHTK